MKTILAFVGLAAFLGVAAMAHLGVKESKREQAIIGLSNGLVWSALQAQLAPRMINAKPDAVAGDRRSGFPGLGGRKSAAALAGRGGADLCLERPSRVLALAVPHGRRRGGRCSGLGPRPA